jgi:hypothetical protein
VSKRHQPFMVLGKVDSDRAVKTTNEGQGKKRGGTHSKRCLSVVCPADAC